MSRETPPADDELPDITALVVEMTELHENGSCRRVSRPDFVRLGCRLANFGAVFVRQRDRSTVTFS